MQRVALINGKNKNQDYDLSKIFSSIATSGIVDGLEVQNGKVTPGYAFIEVERNGVIFNVLFQNTEDLVIDTTGTKKVFIEINQSNIDDGTINSSDGTGIGEIKTASSYPTKNFIALASITSGVITNARSFVKLKGNQVGGDLDFIGGNEPKINGAGLNKINGLVQLGGDGKIDPNLLNSPIVDSTKSTFIAGENLVAGNILCQSIYDITAATSSIKVGETINSTRVGVLLKGNGISSNTFDIFLSKTGTPTQNLNFRIETDNGGKPSGTLIDVNAYGTIAQASLTTSLVKYTITLNSSITILKGVKCWLVGFQGTYGTETISSTNYYNIGYNSIGITRNYKNTNGVAWGDYVYASDIIGSGFYNGGDTLEHGVRIQPKGNIYIQSVTVNVGTTAYIRDDSGALIASSAVSGGVATFNNVLLNNGIIYRITSSGATRRYESKTFPVVGTNLNYISGYSGGINTTEFSNINSLQTSLYNTNGYNQNVVISSSIFSNNEILKADASNIYKLDVKGFAVNGVSSGGNVSIDKTGLSNTQTGLIIGSDYFLSNTPGAISITPGTNIVGVGKAISTTGIDINIDRVKQLSAITPTVGASPYTYQNTTGRPVLVNITGGTVSQVAYSRDNSNYYQTAGATNTFVVLGVNDYVKITYTGTPTLKIFTI